MNNQTIENSFFKNIQSFILGNLKYFITVFLLILLSFISYQTYNYFLIKDIKKTSIEFFNTINENNKIIENLNELKNENNIFSTLSILKIIQKNNSNNNFESSNELYKQLINSSNLDNLYKSSICVHASYTLIDASYLENTNKYYDDLSFYINTISEDLESYYSVKKELEYLFLVMKIDIDKKDYKNNSKTSEIYKEIISSNLISSTVKERVKKIHEFQLYK